MEDAVQARIEMLQKSAAGCEFPLRSEIHFMVMSAKNIVRGIVLHGNRKGKYKNQSF